MCIPGGVSPPRAGRVALGCRRVRLRFPSSPESEGPRINPEHTLAGHCFAVRIQLHTADRPLFADAHQEFQANSKHNTRLWVCHCVRGGASSPPRVCTQHTTKTASALAPSMWGQNRRLGINAHTELSPLPPKAGGSCTAPPDGRAGVTHGGSPPRAGGESGVVVAKGRARTPGHGFRLRCVQSVSIAW